MSEQRRGGQTHKPEATGVNNFGFKAVAEALVAQGALTANEIRAVYLQSIDPTGKKYSDSTYIGTTLNNDFHRARFEGITRIKVGITSLDENHYIYFDANPALDSTEREAKINAALERARKKKQKVTLRE